MKKALSFIVFLFVIACKNNISQDEITLLNGYWEIEKVVMANGQIKEYNVNTTVDFIEINDLSGFRKKVYPKLDGTFDTTNDAEKFTLFNKNGEYVMQYKTNLSEWSELLKSLDNDAFSVLNSENITYHYKRFEPINVSK